MLTEKGDTDSATKSASMGVIGFGSYERPN